MELKFGATILQNFDGVPYQGQIVKMGTAGYIIGVTRQIRRQICKSFGDIVEVVIRLTTSKGGYADDY